MTVNGQSLIVPLSNGFVLPYQGKLYTGGYDSSKKKIIVYELNELLQKKDSLSLEEDYHPDGYYPILADTIHRYLQIVLQRKNASTVSLFRLRGCNLVSRAENVEIPRLYHSNQPGNFFYEATCFYKIEKHIFNDSARFVITAHQLNDTTGNLSYSQKWQYTTDKPGVMAMNIVGTTSDFLYVYVIRENHSRYTSWLLKFSRLSGNFIQAKRIAPENDEVVVTPTDCKIDTLNQLIFITGQVFSQKEISRIENQLVFKSSQPALVALKLDSLMENLESRRINFQVDIKSGKYYWQCYPKMTAHSPFLVEAVVPFYFSTESNHYSPAFNQLVTFDFMNESTLITIKTSGPIYDFISLKNKFGAAFSINQMEVKDRFYERHSAYRAFTSVFHDKEVVYFFTNSEKQQTNVFKYALTGKTYQLIQQKEPLALYTEVIRLNGSIVNWMIYSNAIHLKTLFHKD